MRNYLLAYQLLVAVALPLGAQDASVPTNPAITVSSEETAKGNVAARAIDGKMDTYWCSSGFGANAWIQYDLGREAKIGAVQIDWEQNAPYKFIISTSVDGQTWKVILDQKTNTTSSSRAYVAAPGFARYVKVTVVESTSSRWACIRELKVLGASGKALESTLK